MLGGKSDKIKTLKEFFETLKNIIKETTNKQFDLKEFKGYSPKLNIQRATDFLRYHIKKEQLDETTVRTKLEEWLKDMEEKDQFQFQKSKESTFVSYNANSKLKDKKTLEKLIEDNPKGVLLDNDILKYTYSGIRADIKSLIQRRECIPIRSKEVTKDRTRDDNYEGYYLFSLPPEIKALENYQDYFKISLENSESANASDAEKTTENRFETKTSVYRKMYEDICSENINKQMANNLPFASNKEKKIIEFADEINRKAIPNLEAILRKRAEDRK